MEKKKPFAARLETFFAGKGFYVVLFLCVAVIGVSAWSLLTGGLAPGQRPEEALAVDAIAESAVPAVKPSPVTVTEAPLRTPQPTPVPTAAPTEAPPPTAAPAAPVQEYYIWPVSGEIAAGYAMEVLAWNPTMRDWRTHDGVDIAVALGTQVKAVTNGRVASSASSRPSTLTCSPVSPVSSAMSQGTPPAGSLCLAEPRQARTLPPVSSSPP